MSGTPVASEEPKVSAVGKAAAGAQAGVDRRRRRRAKISAQVHVRALNSPQPFEEVCTSVDVSRDGLLFASKFAGYSKGQRVEVTFPYSSVQGSNMTGQPAEIVRVTAQPDGKHAVAVHFLSAKADSKNDKKSASTGTGAGSARPGVTSEVQSVVLAIEPDQRASEMMRSMLEQDGYSVVTVPSAQAALEILRTTVPSVFIAEVEAEDMSGHDLCVIIKQNERLQNVPVVLMTRSAQPADYSTSHQLGAVVCMAKPFKPERLQQVVRLVAPPPALGGTRTGGVSIDRNLS